MDELKISHIVDNFYLSGSGPISGYKTEQNLQDNDIKVVISMIPHKLRALDAAKLDFHKYYPLNDQPDENISKYFDQIYADISPHLGKNILVHCMQGVSRSSTTLISIMLNLMNSKGKLKKLSNGTKQVYFTDLLIKILRDRRSIVDPNPGFKKQLYEYELHLLNKINNLAGA